MAQRDKTLETTPNPCEMTRAIATELLENRRAMDNDITNPPHEIPKRKKSLQRVKGVCYQAGFYPPDNHAAKKKKNKTNPRLWHKLLSMSLVNDTCQ